MTKSSNEASEPYQQHDTAFKWLIKKFPDDFFKVFFPHKSISFSRSLDKEFIQRLEQYKAPVEADLLMALQVLIEGEIRDVIVLLELKSQRIDIRKQVRNYCLHALMSFGEAVWPIVLFTDDKTWQAPAVERIPVFYSSVEGVVHLVIDLIKIKQHLAEELSRQSALLAKLVALKANDANISRSQLVAAIYQAFQASNDHEYDTLLLVERFVKQYSNLSEDTVKQIKEATGMQVVAETITEYYIMEGKREGLVEGRREGLVEGKRKGLVEGERKGLVEGKREGLVEGRRKGLVEGERKGEILGQLKILEDLYADRLIEPSVYKSRNRVLRKQLKALQQDLKT